MADTGFIVHRTYLYQDNKPQLVFLGRLNQGQTFAIIINTEQPCFYIRQSQSVLIDIPTQDTEYKTIDGEPVKKCSFPNTQEYDKQVNHLKAMGIRLYESDIAFHDSFLMDKGIKGQISIEGTWIKGDRVDRIYRNPEIKRQEEWPQLSYLVFDIETNPYEDEIWAFSAVLQGPSESKEGVWDSRDLGGEKELLTHFRSLVQEWDPDIITGWNIIDFDLPYVFKRMKKLGVTSDWGRSKEPARYFPSEGKQGPSYQIPGRQVLDGLRAVRSGPDQFDDYKLETVAQAVLGRGKEIEEAGTDKLKKLIDLRTNRKEDFLSYCLEDSRLVRDILEKTGLMALTIRRAALTGISITKAWTSIQAFEFLYGVELHKRAYVLPDYGVDTLPTGDALGGAIITPKAGLYRNVLTFDFKSLYPSIIRSFNIDPLSYLPPYRYPETFPAHKREEFIETPGGQLFSREPAILPEVLTKFHNYREKAKQNEDNIASFVYKIIQNSIYGCLGSPGCRLAGNDLAGAITGFGHYLLNWCKQWFLDQGHPVIYGDTDSVFVHIPEELSPQELYSKGQLLTRQINTDLNIHVKEKFNVQSVLDLEFETIFAHFFLPTLRHSLDLTQGRAKGYAGLPWRKNNDQWNKGKLIIKGMEAVRRDWTRLAKDMQLELLDLLFTEQKQESFASYLKALVKDLKEGLKDEQCQYTKMLRKPVAAYTKSRPPHVQAAALLPPQKQQGLIRYCITTEGPQPVGMGQIDYNHYIEKQLIPIAESIEGVLSFKITPFLDSTGQLDLF
ncbi:DNA polymerase II [Spirochaeta cellobiosiphila]|uniref:DNA polymerase II n=1 Tax=Spirochaeta cellobiosiphila TaxID=504483 RepID=UPI0003F4E826|nr:DNA polymerase II [Spirochaeta cellobiosiphila]